MSTKGPICDGEQVFASETERRLFEIIHPIALLNLESTRPRDLAQILRAAAAECERLDETREGASCPT
jgi:hypothetical protein